jgi:hypothetical protein
MWEKHDALVRYEMANRISARAALIDLAVRTELQRIGSHVPRVGDMVGILREHGIRTSLRLVGQSYQRLGRWTNGPREPARRKHH